MPDLIGQKIGRYQVVERLGKGGMATVYAAYDTRLERHVAIKVINAAEDDTDIFLKRFDREAKALAKLTHANIVSVIDYGKQGGMPYLVMEYLPGGTLKSLMGRPLPYEQAVELLLPIAHALDYAHQRSIVHRDIKPTNILLTESRQPMLSDFGIAKITASEDRSELTDGLGIGTPHYMAPEQGQGKEVDGRADIYALGVMLYELVTGRKPYDAKTPIAIVIQHISSPLPGPKTFIPNLPDEVDALICKALEKLPEDRFKSMGAFVAALEQISHAQRKTETLRGPLLEVKPNYLNFGALDPDAGAGRQPVIPLTITNNGRGTLQGKIGPRVSWIEVSPAEFLCERGQTATHRVSLNAKAPMTLGQAQTSLHDLLLIESNGGSLLIGGTYALHSETAPRSRRPLVILLVSALLVLMLAACIVAWGIATCWQFTGRCESPAPTQQAVLQQMDQDATVNLPAAALNLNEDDIGPGFSLYAEQGKGPDTPELVRDTSQRVFVNQGTTYSVESTVTIFEYVPQDPLETLFRRVEENLHATYSNQEITFDSLKPIEIGSRAVVREFSVEELSVHGAILVMIRQNVMLVLVETTDTDANPVQNALTHAQWIDQAIQAGIKF